MLQFAIPLCAARTWKTEHYFHEVDEPGSGCDDGWDFSPLQAAFFGLLFGVESRRSEHAN